MVDAEDHSECGHDNSPMSMPWTEYLVVCEAARVPVFRSSLHSTLCSPDKIGAFQCYEVYAQKPSSGNAKDRGTPKCPPFIMDFVEVRCTQ